MNSNYSRTWRLVCLGALSSRHRWFKVLDCNMQIVHIAHINAVGTILSWRGKGWCGGQQAREPFRNLLGHFMEMRTRTSPTYTFCSIQGADGRQLECDWRWIPQMRQCDNAFGKNHTLIPKISACYNYANDSVSGCGYGDLLKCGHWIMEFVWEREREREVWAVVEPCYRVAAW